MNEIALWVVALTTAALGLLLLGVAGLAAALIKARRNAALEEDLVAGPDEASAKETRDGPEDSLHEVSPSTARGTGVWLWLQAWLFASLHALVVSLVLGAITFYEDIVQSHREIARTGRVSFPKNLLPGSMVVSARNRLVRSGEDYSRYEAADDGFLGLDQGEDLMAEVTEWDAVSLHESVERH